MAETADKINALPSLRTMVEAHRLLADKSLGQNFLLDQNITDKIIRDSLAAQQLPDFQNAEVFEVGPGPGGLTRAVLKADPRRLTVIEMDMRCVEIMKEMQAKIGDVLHIVARDALKFDFGQSAAAPKHIVSNLPYNISVPLLTGWLKQIRNFKSLTLMFQKEVADRILAPTHCKDYGRLSILAQLQCKIIRLFDLRPECFVPAPKIWSSVLLFQPAEKPLSFAQTEALEKLTALAFSGRRKMIRQTLKSQPRLIEACAAADVPLTARPEEISPGQFLTLSQNL